MRQMQSLITVVSVQVLAVFPELSFQRVISAQGGAVLPGFVDGHTHPVWAGDRVHEFAMKLAGASYMEVHAAGGGIHFTVERTREAEEASANLRLTRVMKRNKLAEQIKEQQELLISLQDQVDAFVLRTFPTLG